MRSLRMAAGVLVVGGVSACGFPALEELRVTEPEGTPFTRALADDYLALSEFEYQQRDWGSTRIYSEKGLAAAQGAVVPPFEPGGWGLAPELRAPAEASRADLLRLLNANGRSRAPEIAAQAQASFDCWIEQLSEGHQEAHIAACRRDFDAAMVALAQALQPEPVAEPEPEPVPEVEMVLDRFQVYFDWDEATISPAARRIIAAAAQRAQELPETALLVIGHADRSGPAAYNEGLSRRRAEAVREVLVENGVDPERIRLEARGELEPVVPTGDGVREPQNRRVVIRFQPQS